MRRRGEKAFPSQPEKRQLLQSAVEMLQSSILGQAGQGRVWPFRIRPDSELQGDEKTAVASGGQMMRSTVLEQELWAAGPREGGGQQGQRGKDLPPNRLRSSQGDARPEHGAPESSMRPLGKI